MKKFFTVVLLAAGIFVAGNAHSQMKAGYISVDNVVSLMPETAKMDSLLQRYQDDSLTPRYAQIVSLYQYKDSVYRDSIHPAPAAVKKQIEEELPTLAYQIQNWQAIVQQATESKQNELLAPVYRKVYDAIKAVAKEKGYTHVFNKEAFLVAPDGDDMLTAVATKLKIKLPTNPNSGAGK
jgi:outer membrane protein